MLYFVGTKPRANNENDRLPEFVENGIYQYGYIGEDSGRNEGNYQYRYYQKFKLAMFCWQKAKISNRVRKLSVR
ncbi:hypothetical protein JCM19233_7506 [Vibrio astriarenae]|nr:hypothetical protein JCM19233_7506 [Vibrio sp. C7]